MPPPIPPPIPPPLPRRFWYRPGNRQAVLWGLIGLLVGILVGFAAHALLYRELTPEEQAQRVVRHQAEVLRQMFGTAGTGTEPNR